MTEKSTHVHDEGWGVIRPGDRKAHYYRDGMALCRRVGFYQGPLYPEDGNTGSYDDHKECRTLLDREKARAAREVAKIDQFLDREGARSAAKEASR